MDRDPAAQARILDLRLGCFVYVCERVCVRVYVCVCARVCMCVCIYMVRYTVSQRVQREQVEEWSGGRCYNVHHGSAP